MNASHERNPTQEIIVVSGLPRSGTSLMMQMLHNGGVEVVTDHLRTADSDNPRGYYEFEAVKEIESDCSWLPSTRGKAVKLISMLLYHLPATERYRILFMERDLDEVLRSQETMLKRLNRQPAPRTDMLNAYQIHLGSLREWISTRTDIAVLTVDYRRLIEQPDLEAKKICEFLGRDLNLDAMKSSIDVELYRNRRQPS